MTMAADPERGIADNGEIKARMPADHPLRPVGPSSMTP
jgi:hypothetical protein